LVVVVVVVATAMAAVVIVAGDDFLRDGTPCRLLVVPANRLQPNDEVYTLIREEFTISRSICIWFPLLNRRSKICSF